MANPSLPFAPVTEGIQSMAALSNALLQTMIEAQRTQIAVLTAWQKSLFAINQELWDEWTCRFAGGAPIDV